jgi:hypothetical protein
MTGKSGRGIPRRIFLSPIFLLPTDELLPGADELLLGADESLLGADEPLLGVDELLHGADESLQSGMELVSHVRDTTYGKNNRRTGMRQNVAPLNP